VLLFLVTWILGAAGAVGGSMIGAAFGNVPLFTFAMMGGALGSMIGVRIAAWRGWVARERRNRVMVGVLIGFALAAVIATLTLTSPVGPIVGSLLIGTGAVIANRR
jgi:uncharacterized membrane protein